MAIHIVSLRKAHIFALYSDRDRDEISGNCEWWEHYCYNVSLELRVPSAKAEISVGQNRFRVRRPARYFVFSMNISNCVAPSWLDNLQEQVADGIQGILNTRMKLLQIP